jgi:septum formation protein
MLVLASKSPRRAEILRAAGLPFVARPADIEEQRLDGESPTDYARRLAIDKAGAVRIDAGEIVLGADTIVVVDDVVLEKPCGDADARRMLQFLAGRTHEVITGICLRSGVRSVADTAVTRVTFSPLTPDEVDAYVASGEPMDKAGAYGIQGLASKFIERIEGDYFNVVGLPVSLVFRHLKQFE